MSKYDPEQDGITHINVYSKGNTSLGRWLSNFTECEIETYLGNFKSIEGLIFYLGSFREELRTLSGFAAKNVGNNLDRGIRLPNDIFRKIIKDAIKYKIQNNEQMLKEFKENQLPLSHYYSFSGKVIKIPKWNWIIEYMENLKKELNE